MGNDLRKSVLVICPWMDHSTFSRGMVFREQARVLKDDFNYTFLNFQKFGISDVLKFRSLVRRKPFYDDNFKESYVYVYYLNSSYFFSWLNSWIEKLAVNAVYKAFCVEKKSFQLIHVQCLIDSGVFGYLLGKKMNLPYIITEHAQINLVGISVKRHKFLQVVLNEAKRRLLVSRHKIAQYATGRLYGEFEVVGNMVNESNFFYLPKPQTNNFKIITVGAYTPIKDQLTLLKALKLLDGTLFSSSIEFHWAGINAWSEGKDLEAQRLVSSFDFKNIKIILTGVLSREGMANAYRGADIFVFTSLSEGMPLAMIEALACGVPVITTRWGGADEIITEKNGRIVGLRDYVGIFEELKYLIENVNVFNRKEISRDAIAKFGSEVFRDKLARIYNKTLDENV